LAVDFEENKVVTEGFGHLVFLRNKSYSGGLRVAARELRNLGSFLEHLEQIASFWKLSKLSVEAKHSA